MNGWTEDLLLEVALRGVAERYAIAVDTGDGDLFAAQFTHDGVLESPRGVFKGHASLATVPALVRKRYAETFHGVLNLVAHRDGEGAEALTYCIARHFRRGEDDGLLCYEMTIRYRDAFALEIGRWRLSRRRLLVLGNRTFPMDAATPFGRQD